MSNLGEPRVPKPKQGGNTAGTPKPPIRKGNSGGSAGTGGVKKGTRTPGTNGRGSKNHPPRT